jgi:hypothetical protein
MDDYEMDEAESFGLGGLYPEEQGEETANITSASSRGALMFGAPEILSKYGEATKEYETSIQEVLRQMQAARDKLLNQPTEQSRGEQLRGIAMALAAPRERDDPRFYERRNLYTFLRDIGEYGAAQKAAQKKAEEEKQKQISLADFQIAQEKAKVADAKRRELAGLAEKYAARREPQEPEKIRSDRIRAQELGITLAELYKREAAEKRLLAGRSGAGTGEDKYVNEFSILQDPTATPAQKSAALARLPPDVRKNWQAAGKNDVSYADRIEQLQSFTLPDVKRAIAMVKKNPNLSAGTLAAFIKGTPIVGQAATDLDNTLSVIRSAVGFDKLEELKKLSPYGASGLGAVSNAEQKLLQSVKGSLEQDNSASNLIYNLERLQRFYEESVPTIIASQGIDLEAIRRSGTQGGAAEAQTGGAGGLGISADAIRAERERRKKQRGGQ